MSNKFLFSPEYYETLAYYNEVDANLTWYKLNSGYNDPMYQYMNKLSLELRLKVILPLLNSNYNTIDDFVVTNNLAPLVYGTYECSAPGKQVYMDSWFSCFLFQLPFFLERIQLGYIGFVFVLPIMLISIFGGIKESYKWFILHQAIWDAFLCYDFICSKPTFFGWSLPKNYIDDNTCFYRHQTSNLYTFYFPIFQGFRVFLRNASFIPVFHLALSRFICMYFPGFYKRFTRNGYKIFIFLLLFNVICVAIFCFSSLTTTSSNASIQAENLKCNEFCPSLNLTYCQLNIPKYFQCINRNIYEGTTNALLQKRLIFIFKLISYSVTPAMFLLSIVCAGFLFYKIASQLQFQLKTNRDSFKQSIKISSVVGFQCLTMSFMFVITGIQKYMQIKSVTMDTKIIYDDLPTWLFLLQNYTTTASLNMIRILLDSCIILTVLSGYSRCVVLSVKFLWLCLTNPQQACNNIKNNVRGTKVTIIPSLQK